MNNFCEILKTATSKIDKSYFKTKIIDEKSGAKYVYRERIYCYELYHQIRKTWPVTNELELHGEYDKSGSSLFGGENLKNIKPDFLIHKAGDTDSNFIAIEVKPVTARKAAIISDLNKLSSLKLNAKYRFVMYLIYGENSTIKAKAIHKLIAELRIKEDINIWAHNNPGVEAELVQANSSTSTSLI